MYSICVSTKCHWRYHGRWKQCKGNGETEKVLVCFSTPVVAFVLFLRKERLSTIAHRS